MLCIIRKSNFVTKIPVSIANGGGWVFFSTKAPTGPGSYCKYIACECIKKYYI